MAKEYNCEKKGEKTPTLMKVSLIVLNKDVLFAF
jgi:hypothetical protein